LYPYLTLYRAGQKKSPDCSENWYKFSMEYSDFGKNIGKCLICIVWLEKWWENSFPLHLYDHGIY